MDVISVYMQPCMDALVPLVYVGKEEISKYMPYEVSMAAYMDKIASQRKVPKWHLKTIGQNQTKYEVSMFKPMTRRGVHRGQHQHQ